jgi:hypothetical protein
MVRYNEHIKDIRNNNEMTVSFDNKENALQILNIQKKVHISTHKEISYL